MSDRRRARVLAMQALCQLEALGEDFLAQLEEFLDDESPPPTVTSYAKKLVRKASTDLQAIDLAIQTAASNWEIKRMAIVDRNIIRVAVCELRETGDVPPTVVIDEAVEIAKTFGTADSPAFVNGVLDAVRKTRETQAPDSPPAGN